MLVISIDEIPNSPPELLELSKDIPSFVRSALSIGTVWLAHAKWSRTFGLQDSITVYLSLALVVLMLVFVYPIKLMMQATVLYISLNIFDIRILDAGLFDEISWEDLQSLVALFYICCCRTDFSWRDNCSVLSKCAPSCEGVAHHGV